MKQHLAAQICTLQNIKMTLQRKIIIEVIRDAKDHPDAESIHARAIAINCKISLATVYRTLLLFESHHIVKKLEIGDGKARYELVSKTKEHHHHLIDIKTGDIIEFSNPMLEAMKEQIAAELGYELVDHRLELYGIKKS